MLHHIQAACLCSQICDLQKSLPQAPSPRKRGRTQLDSFYIHVPTFLSLLHYSIFHMCFWQSAALNGSQEARRLNGRWLFVYLDSAVLYAETRLRHRGIWRTCSCGLHQEFKRTMAAIPSRTSNICIYIHMERLYMCAGKFRQTHIYIYTYLPMCIHIYIYIDVCMESRVYTYTYIYIYIHNHVFCFLNSLSVSIYVKRSVCVCVFQHIHVFMHAYMAQYTQKPSSTSTFEPLNKGPPGVACITVAGSAAAAGGAGVGTDVLARLWA